MRARSKIYLYLNEYSKQRNTALGLEFLCFILGCPVKQYICIMSIKYINASLFFHIVTRLQLLRIAIDCISIYIHLESKNTTFIGL